MLTGSLNWAITLGRWDVMFAFTTMTRYNNAPRMGHMKVMLRVFGYLKYHAKCAIKFDVTYPTSPIKTVSPDYWKKMYPNAIEKVPNDFPVP